MIADHHPISVQKRNKNRKTKRSDEARSPSLTRPSALPSNGPSLHIHIIVGFAKRLLITCHRLNIVLGNLIIIHIEGLPSPVDLVLLPKDFLDLA